MIKILTLKNIDCSNYRDWCRLIINLERNLVLATLSARGIPGWRQIGR